MIAGPGGTPVATRPSDGGYWLDLMLLQKPPKLEGPPFVVQPVVPAQQGLTPQTVVLPWACPCQSRAEADAGLEGAERLPRERGAPPVLVGTWRRSAVTDGTVQERRAHANALRSVLVQVQPELEKVVARMLALQGPVAGSA